MDGLQAATSVIALAELARRTALLIRRVCNAHRDAEGLCQKTQQLSHLLQNVGEILEKRQKRKGNATSNAQEPSIENAIEASLSLCRECLNDMESRFRPLVDRDSNLTVQQLRQRLKYVRKQSYIAARERDIGIQLKYLSVALLCLSQEEQSEQRAELDAERQNREQASRQQLEMQQAFLRQLFSLLQFVFQAATRASSTGDNEQTAEFLRQFSEQLGTQDIPSVGNEDPQPTLEDIFATSSSQGNLQRRYEDYVFNTTRVVEEVDVDENDSIEELDAEILPEQTVKQELSDLDEPLVNNLPQYANETTLLLAIKQGNTDLVRNLLESITSTTPTDSHNWTVLHHAVFCLHEPVVEILLKHEQCTAPDILNAQTKTGETALIFAAQRVDRNSSSTSNAQPKGYSIAQRLLTHQTCDVNVSDGVGSALYYAIKEGRPSSRPRRDLIRSLIRKGADVNTVREQIPESVENYEDLLSQVAEGGDGGEGARRGGEGARRGGEGARRGGEGARRGGEGESAANQTSREDENNRTERGNGETLQRRLSKVFSRSKPDGS